MCQINVIDWCFISYVLFSACQLVSAKPAKKNIFFLGGGEEGGGGYAISIAGFMIIQCNELYTF